MKLKTSRGIAVACCTTLLVSATKAVFSQKLRIRNVGFALLCCAALMFVAAPARADICSDNFPVPSCGVTITITGTSGHLVATFGGTGNPYDTLEDQLVGITNNSSVAVGAIVLSGPAVAEPVFAFDVDGPCVALTTTTVCGTPTGYEGPNNKFVGISPDSTTGKVLFTTPLAANGGTTWFALENIPTTVVAVGENKTLTAGQTTTFAFGPFSGGTETSGQDDYQITPLNSASGDTLDTLTVTPVPVPAGPLGLDNWGPNNFGIETPAALVAGQSRFSASNFSTLACVPYADFSSSGNPVCIELELDCTGTDSCGFIYSAQNHFEIDAFSLPNGIGGPAFLGQHGVPCPTTAFNFNIFLSYTPDPLKGGGSGTGSCFAVTFDPTAKEVAAGQTVGFTGFSGLSATTNNPVNPGSSEPLNFTYTTSSGTVAVAPITNLHWCKSFPNTGSTCADHSASPPWVAFATFPISCSGGGSPNTTPPNDVAGNSNLQNLGGGSYRFNWKTLKTATLKTCVTVLTQFDTGVFVFPDNFIYMKQ